jgi:hypothetical protein
MRGRRSLRAPRALTGWEALPRIAVASERDSLAGIPPISGSAFKSRFHIKCQIGDASGIC